MCIGLVVNCFYYYDVCVVLFCWLCVSEVGLCELGVLLYVVGCIYDVIEW